MYAFVVTLREGLEAALIVGILLAYLNKSQIGQGKRSVWIGTGLALGFSLAGGLLIHWLMGGMSGGSLDAFEGVMMLVATVILSGMIVTMQRNARNLSANLASKAAMAGGGWGLVALAFTVVGREGVETVLYLAGGAATAESGTLYTLAGVAGGLVAALLGWGIYQGSLKLNLRRFFTISGLLLIVFAAGMLANGFKELQEVHWVPPIVAHVWDTYDYLSDTTPGGRLLAALLGYDASPSLLQVIGSFGYLLITGGLFLRGLRPTPSRRGTPAA